jgi:hypothetical protein
LSKKGKKRFFVLKDGSLYWYANEKADKHKGKLVLYGCTVEAVKEKRNTLTIIPPEGKSYDLTADIVPDYEEWLLALSASAKRNPKGSSFSLSDLKQQAAVEKTSPREAEKKEPEKIIESVEKRGWMMKKYQKRYFIVRICRYDTPFALERWSQIRTLLPCRHLIIDD